MIRLKTNIVVNIFVLIYASIIFLGLKKLIVWDQIIDLWIIDTNPQDGIFIGAHGLRYLIMYPILISSKLLEIDKDYFFSYISIIVFYYVLHTINITAKNYDKNYNIFSAIILNIIFLLAFWFINGRGIFMLLGYAMVVSFIVKSNLNLQNTFKLLIGLFFCGISTGVFASACLQVLFMSPRFIDLKKIEQKYIIPIILFLIFFSQFFLYFFIVGIKKNIDYYGGGFDGFINMFSHGYGSTFFSNDKYVLIASFLIVFLILITMIMIIIRYNHRITDMEALLLINIALGVFGNTTAAMAWIPLSILLTIYLKFSFK